MHLAQMPSPSDAQEVGRARSPSSRGAASAGASVGKTCTAIQGEPALQLAQMASPSDAQEGPVAAVPPAQVQALAYTLRWPFSQALMTAEYYMTSGRTVVCHITSKRSMARCHCQPASQALMTAGRECIRQSNSLLHHRLEAQCLQPLPYLLASTDEGRVGNDSGRTAVCCISAKRLKACCHCWPFSQAPMTAEYERHRAEGPSAASQPRNQGLLPLLDFLASTDGGIVGNDIRQSSSLLRNFQKAKGLLPLLTPLTGTDGSIVDDDIGRTEDCCMTAKGPKAAATASPSHKH